MDFDQLLTIIGNYAFPICCCVYLFWSNAKERDAHKEEVNRITEALHNNTVALTKIEELLQNGR